MMLSGEPISAADALAAGLVDKVVPPAELLPAARQLALALADGRVPRRRTLQLGQHTPQGGEQLAAAVAALQACKARAGRCHAGQQHYLALIDAVAEGLAHGAAAGLQKVQPSCPAGTS